MSVVVEADAAEDGVGEIVVGTVVQNVGEETEGEVAARTVGAVVGDTSLIRSEDVVATLLGGQASEDRRGVSHESPPARLFSNISSMSCTQFIAKVLSPCTNKRLAKTVTEHEAMWTASWHQAASLDGTTVQTLLTALARLPPTATIAAPRLRDVTGAVAVFLRFAKDPNMALGTGLSVEEAKLRAVEVIEGLFHRLTKFVWNNPLRDVHEALNDMLADADALLESRYPTHRKARERVMLLFSELDKPWLIRTSDGTVATTANALTTPDLSSISPWKRATVEWLLDWNNFQPLKLPSMKVPGGHGDGVYESPDEYFDTTIKLWTGMTFVDGHNALLPHCTQTLNEKVCDQPLWPMQTRGFPNYHCRTRDCSRLVEYVCANRMHHIGFCKSCAVDRQQKLRGPPSSHASTHIYDAIVRNLRYDGKLFLTNVASRRPPLTAIHWKTTRRLSSPNLVGIVLLSSRGGALQLSDEIYWAKVALHGAPRDEYLERESGCVVLELLEYTVDETGNPLLAKEVERGANVAIIDCQTFVPEFIPVLKALERQRELPMPFQSGALVNLKRIRGLGEIGGSAQAHVEEFDGDRNVPGLVELFDHGLDEHSVHSLIHTLVEHSMLDPIVQIRRNASTAELLRNALTTLVTRATLDRGQLISFVEALTNAVHCTQGPPGTGKSYLGVVIVRALLIIRKLWIQVSPSVGEPPILVLSYKNHAIDEFLVDLVKAEHSIQFGATSLVRLGGGCTEPALYRYQESSVIASASEVATLTQTLDQLHQLAATVRCFRDTFSVFYEAQVLVANDEASHSELEDARERNKSEDISSGRAITGCSGDTQVHKHGEPSVCFNLR